MHHIYSRDRYITTIEPIPYAKQAKYQSLVLHLIERLEQYQFEIGEYIAHEGDRLLRDLIELNKFIPCEEALKPRPHLEVDSVYKNLKFKKSGDRFMDDLADLAIDLGSYDQAVSLTHQLTQSQIHHFRFRFIERSRSPEQLINEQNKEYFFKEWLAEDWNREYMSKAFNS